MKRKKRILLLLSGTQKYGGIQSFNNNLIQSLSKYELRILDFNDSSTENIKGFESDKTGFFISALKGVISRPDIIIIGHLHFILLSFFARLLRVKTVTILHGIEAWTPKKSIIKYLKFVDRYWAVSQFTRRKFIEFSRIKSDKVDLIFNTLPHSWPLNSVPVADQKKILTIARLDKLDGYKGVDTILKALAGLKQDLKKDQWKYDIVGSGSDLERHKGLALALGLAEIVNFHEKVDQEAIESLLSSCSFFVLPSGGEGFGIVYLEAMSFKKAVLGASDSGAEEVIVDGKTGFLVEPSVEEIKEKIRLLIISPEKRRLFGEEGYKRLNEKFSFELFNNKINKLISECVV